MPHPTRPRAKPVAALLTALLDPLARKRGLARAELIAWWPEVVGAAYAAHTAPERIRWPRDGKAATLVVRCDPALALQFAHESDRVRDRLNTFFGYPAVGVVKIVQARIGPAAPATPKPERPIPAALAGRLDAVEGPLGDSLRALAKGVVSRS